MKDKDLVKAIRSLYPNLSNSDVRLVYDDVEELDDWDYSDIELSFKRIFYGVEGMF